MIRRPLAPVAIHPRKGQPDGDDPKKARTGVEEKGYQSVRPWKDIDREPHRNQRIERNPDEDQHGADQLLDAG